MNEAITLDISRTLILLLKGIVYADKQAEIFNIVVNQQNQLRDYLTVLHLDLYIDEAEGYAFLKQIEQDKNDASISIPRLMQRRPLSYAVSLLCILLRKKLIEQDTSAGATRVILTHDQIIEMVKIYFPDRSNEVKSINQIETCINKVIDLGFLRPLASESKTYEICRIIKALVDADWVSNIQIKLEEYLDYANKLS